MEKHIGPLAIICMVVIMLSLLPSSDRHMRANTSSFTFTAVGDYGAGINTAAVLDAIATSDASFNLALGDLSYGALKPEGSWCDFVIARIGPDFAFELIAGNHDSGQNAAQGNITNFAACFPDRIGNVVGTYGKEYYFDYPATAPLARLILISPSINFYPEGYYSYASGSSHFNWVSDAIDDARAANIPWVVVAMHKNCIGAGKHACDVESALFNLLIGKKVDLILQAHDHSYQRSKQLAHSASCTAIVAGSYNSDCVADDGADNLYSKDGGPVILVSGMGGRNLYDINTSDPEAEYFAVFMGGNANPTHGIVKFTVSDNQLAAAFVQASGGTFCDNFSIEKTDAVISPGVTLTHSATATPATTDNVAATTSAAAVNPRSAASAILTNTHVPPAAISGNDFIYLPLMLIQPTAWDCTAMIPT